MRYFFLVIYRMELAPDSYRDARFIPSIFILDIVIIFFAQQYIFIQSLNLNFILIQFFLDFIKNSATKIVFFSKNYSYIAQIELFYAKMASGNMNFGMPFLAYFYLKLLSILYVPWP
jgi:hypothetical protein